MTGPLVLVVPVFNEAALIGESLPQILHAARAAEVTSLWRLAA